MGIIIFLLSSLLLQVHAKEQIRNKRYPHLSHHLSTENMIEMAGFTSETHKIITEDNYILTVHRIVGEGPVVFFQHGIEMGSSSWVLLGVEGGSPAFRLAELGYDVWLGNYRGNHYSREHMSMNPDGWFTKYWEFSWDEMGKYDLPAQLNYVLGYTGKEKMHYVGHSMGSTTFLLMNSLNQSWADHIELAVLLAPIAYVDNMKSPIRYFPMGLVGWVLTHLGSGEFFPSNWFMNWIADFACSPGTMFDFICNNILFLIGGYDYEQMNYELMPTIVAHCPAGTSVYTPIQYRQNIKKKQFQGMDWGSNAKNLAHHGSTEIPVYQLKNVNTKIALFYGNNDWLANMKDVFKLFVELPNIVENYPVPYIGQCGNGNCGWNHLDFLWAKEIDKYINHHLIEVLASHPIE